MNSNKDPRDSENKNNEEEKVDKSLRRMKAIKSNTQGPDSPTDSLKSDSEEEN